MKMDGEGDSLRSVPYCTVTVYGIHCTRLYLVRYVHTYSTVCMYCTVRYRGLDRLYTVQYLLYCVQYHPPPTLPGDSRKSTGDHASHAKSHGLTTRERDRWETSLRIPTDCIRYRPWSFGFVPRARASHLPLTPGTQSPSWNGMPNSLFRSAIPPFANLGVRLEADAGRSVRPLRPCTPDSGSRGGRATVPSSTVHTVQ